MISPEYQKLLNDLGKSAYGKALASFLEEELESLNKEKYDQVEKYWAREGTEEIVRRLFSFMKGSNPQGVKGKTTYS